MAARQRLAVPVQARLPGAAAAELRHLFPAEVSLTRAVVVVDVWLPEPLETEAPEVVATVATKRQGLLEQPTRVAAVAAVVLKQAEPVTAVQAALASS